MTAAAPLAARVRPLLWWGLRAHWAIGLALFLALTDASRAALFAAAAAFFAGTVMDLTGRRSAAWHRLGAPLVLAAAAAAVLDAAALGADPLSALSVLVLGIQSVKLLLPKTARDGWQLCAISFLEFLAAAAVTDDIRFAVFVLLFIFLSVAAMWELQIQGAREGGDGSAARAAPRFAGRLVLVSGCAGALLAALLFLVTPRIGIGQLLQRPGRTSGIAGFSNTITLRDVTAIKADRRVVARIEFPARDGPPPGDLYLRGITYAAFDGKTWTRPDAAPAAVPRAGFRYALGPAPPPGAPVFASDIMLEPMDSPAVFVYGNPIELEGGIGLIRTDGEGNFEFAEERHGGARYRLAWSGGSAPSARRKRGPADAYLQLPPGANAVRRLAAEITEGAGRPSERAERIRRFFSTGFRYSTSSLGGSVDEFLLVRRTGHCEHFATALCLLLRAAGIPARVAAGYLGGEWSDVGRYLIVRQSDAHAWTEAWLDGGWVTLDATPPLGENSPFVSRTGLVGIYLDWAKERWDKYVVNYSLKVQADTVVAGFRTLRAIRAGVSRRLPRARGFFAGPAPVVAALALAAAALLAVRQLRRARRSRPGSPDGDAAPPLPAPYAALLRALERRGHRASPGTTVERMVLSAAARLPLLAGDAGRFLALYHRDRFGAASLPPGERLEAERIAERLRAAVLRGGAA